MSINKRSEFESILNKELDFAYSLVRTFTNIDFAKPSLLYGDNYMIERNPDCYNYNEKLPPMIYDDAIVVSNSEENASSDSRIEGFCHEIGHSLLSSINSEFATKNLKSPEFRNMKLLLIIYHVFDEGFAEYVGLNSCLSSGQVGLVDAAHARRKWVDDSFSENISNKNISELDSLFNSEQRYLDVFCSVPAREDDPLWARSLATYFLLNPKNVTLEGLPYVFGYQFVNRALCSGSLSLDFIAKNPPESIEELFSTAAYLERVQQVKK